MVAMVDEANRARRVVAAHCHGKPGIIAALRSGVKTIEHGSFLDEECVDFSLYIIHITIFIFPSPEKQPPFRCYTRKR